MGVRCEAKAAREAGRLMRNQVLAKMAMFLVKMTRFLIKMTRFLFKTCAT